MYDTKCIIDKLNKLEDGHKKIMNEFSMLATERNKVVQQLKSANKQIKFWTVSTFISVMIIIFLLLYEL